MWCYLKCRVAAVRLARRIVGDRDAEDIVQSVVLALLEHRVWLAAAPGERYFMTAVRHSALRLRQYAWYRRTVLMEPVTLSIAEERRYAALRGRPATPLVVLPEEPVG